jgi:16S rRNA C967 or C1407 C5-methylase (RsmB/RsmF family)/NOL1/NOP2/fmu family ribosome biogenesis protein
MQDFPEKFKEKVLQDEFLEGEKLLTALNSISPIAIRFNPFKKNDLSLCDNSVKWCENAYFLKERPIYTLDPLFHAGSYYPQETGSMFLDFVLKKLTLPEEPVILDLCAAPGGKSTLTSSFLNNKGLLVSNEVIQSRAQILKENIIKWGTYNNIVTNNDPKDFNLLKQTFDVIIIDAPCSGEGMFRKDPKTRDEWSEDNVNLCASRQKRIVADCWDALKNEGYLIYSTCTFNSAENEENIQWITKELGGNILNIETDLLPQGRNGIGNYGLPSKVETEGFFIAVIQKNGEYQDFNPKKQKINQDKNITKFKDKSLLEQYINIEPLEILQFKEHLFGVKKEFIDLFFNLKQHLKIIHFGTEIGEISRKGLIPHEVLPFSTLLNNQLPKIEINKQQALHYLKGETFPLEGEKGYCLITYQNQPLGFIKHLGNRFNNLYPKEWRIRMNIN